MFDLFLRPPSKLPETWVFEPLTRFERASRAVATLLRGGYPKNESQPGIATMALSTTPRPSPLLALKHRRLSVPFVLILIALALMLIAAWLGVYSATRHASPIDRATPRFLVHAAPFTGMPDAPGQKLSLAT
jgi:hypothetical protein